MERAGWKSAKHRPMELTSSVGAQARCRNPALQPLSFLIGDWQTSGSHPAVPAKVLLGRTSFAWHEGGAFVIMRSEIDEPRFPSGIAIIGSDNAAGTLSMIYFDERKVSRHYKVTTRRGTITWQRDDPDLSQSVTIMAGSDGQTLTSKGLMSEKRGPWGDDLSQVFIRSP